MELSPAAATAPTDEASRVNGVIFFEFKGELGRCSGTSVNAPNMSVVFTAGHCVHEISGSGSNWYRGRWTFVPGYRFGQRPFGVFPAKWLDATRRWVSEGNENFDVAAAVVGRNEKGQRLAAAVGADRIAFNLPPNQVFDVHGYPVVWSPDRTRIAYSTSAGARRDHQVVRDLDSGRVTLVPDSDTLITAPLAWTRDDRLFFTHNIAGPSGHLKIAEDGGLGPSSVVGTIDAVSVVSINPACD